MYRICIREDAVQEAELARQYSFYDRLMEWFKELALDAESMKPCMSGDFGEFLTALDDAERAAIDVSCGHWVNSYRRLKDATIIEWVRALLIVLRRREAPWRMAVAVTWFTRILGTLDAEVHVIYEVDHANRRIVVNKITGLPGQGY